MYYYGSYNEAQSDEHDGVPSRFYATPRGFSDLNAMYDQEVCEWRRQIASSHPHRYATRTPDQPQSSMIPCSQ